MLGWIVLASFCLSLLFLASYWVATVKLGYKQPCGQCINLCCTRPVASCIIALGSILPSSLGFYLPNLSVESSIEADSHSEIHDSLIHSTLSSFNFHLNLSSISLGASLFIIILVVIISTKQNRAIADISAQILKQKRSLESLMRWKVESINN